MMDYGNWGPADWLAVVIALSIVGQIVSAIACYLVGLLGLALSAAFQLGKGRTIAAHDASERSE